jgi:chorismate mutase
MSQTMTIEDWRQNIDALEGDLVSLLNRRAQCAVGIGEIKKAQGLPVFDAKREQEILERVGLRTQGPLPAESIQRIFQVIMEETRRLEE